MWDPRATAAAGGAASLAGSCGTGAGLVVCPAAAGVLQGFPPVSGVVMSPPRVAAVNTSSALEAE